MKKLMAVLAAMAFVVVMAGGAWADVTGSVDINASVTGKCNAITANDLTLTIDPATTSAVSSTGSATTVQCSKSKAFTVTAASAGAGGAADSDGSLDGVLTGTGADIPYTLAYTSSFNGAGFGSASPTTLLTANAATVAVADANAAEEGSDYTDTVTITVVY